MRILMCNRARDLWVGGDMVQMDATTDELRKRGHEVRQVQGDEDADYGWADVVHLWNLPMPWTFAQYCEAKNAGKPVVVSTIYNDIDRLLPYSMQGRILRGADAIICLCDGEVHRMAQRHKFDREKVRIIPNGIEEFWFKSNPQDGGYLLTVGRLEEFKGQRYVAAVAKKLGLRYVCIGDGDEKELLEKLGATVIGSMPRKELLPYYEHCTAYVLASQAEVFPLTVMEAGAVGRPIIMTRNSCWKPDGAILCDHGDQVSIKEAISWTASRGTIDVIDMRWDSVVSKLEEVYRWIV